MTACRDAFCPRAEREIACAQKIIDNKDAEIARLTVNNATALEALKAARDHRHAYSTHRLIHAAIKLLEGEAEHDC